MIKRPRLYISAAHKSSGKTTLSIGLCRALANRGHRVHPFKKGPDYIDPMWLSSASRHACYNLDFNTMSHDEIMRYLLNKATDKSLSIIEGNKGLYDGMDLEGADSNAALATLLDAPVILVINARGTTRGVVPLLLGYQQFDPSINIASVIYNQVGGARHAKKLRAVTEHYTDIPVIGTVQNHPDMEIKERHLGLMPSNERRDAEHTIESIARIVAEQVDLDRIEQIISESVDLPIASDEIPMELGSSISLGASGDYAISPQVKIGICKDPAFGFYYQSDLESLQAAGAQLIPINTLSDKTLPDIDGLFIGGGFPETQMQALSANTVLRQSIQQSIEQGLPVYAECGGLMYLSQSIVWGEEGAKQSYPMVGVIPADAVMCKKPQGRGIVRVETTKERLWTQILDNVSIQAHEFHYSRLEVNADEKHSVSGTSLTDVLQSKGTFAYRMKRGQGIDGLHDGWVYKNLLASYTHMRDTSQHRWASAFVEFVINNKKETI